MLDDLSKSNVHVKFIHFGWFVETLWQFKIDHFLGRKIEKNDIQLLISSKIFDGFEISLNFLEVDVVLVVWAKNEPFPMILTEVR